MTAKRKAKSGVRALAASSEARRCGAVVLEVLTGLISPTEATQSLSISLPRYYALETRALQGFLGALEPRPRGRQKTPQSQVRALEKEVSRLSRELARTRSLVRVAHRTIGITTPAASTTKRGSTRSTKAKADAKPARRRRGVARGEKVAKALAVPPPSDAGEEA
jgi:hypothetical protein